MLSQKTRDEGLPESDRLAAAYGFIDPKYTIDQGRLPYARLYIYAKFDQ